MSRTQCNGALLPTTRGGRRQTPWRPGRWNRTAAWRVHHERAARRACSRVTAQRRPLARRPDARACESSGYGLEGRPGAWGQLPEVGAGQSVSVSSRSLGFGRRAGSVPILLTARAQPGCDGQLIGMRGWSPLSCRQRERPQMGWRARYAQSGAPLRALAENRPQPCPAIPDLLN